jgi:mannose-6-phosphate isomerase-like protein (cupin superfamily)
MTDDDPNRPLGLVGGIGLTEVSVYDQRPAPDGAFSGCPHVHAVVDEAYYILRGAGYVEFHDLVHGLRTVPLNPGDYLHFPPLVMHRLVSKAGLVILGVMSSAGLAERGEARVYFGPEVDAEPTRYAELMSLPKTRGLEGALDRRDAAVRGYQGLMRLWQTDRRAYDAELKRFFEVHRKAMASRAPELTEQVEQGPLAWAQTTMDRIHQLPSPMGLTGEVCRNAAGSESAFGMCGTLRPMLQLERLGG